MNLVLFSAIPKVALFFLLLVGLAILAEIIYLAKKKLDSQEVTLPKSLQTPSSLPIQPAVVSVTTEIVSETPKKGRLTRKTTMVILSTLLIAITIPVGLALVKQRQGVQKMAAGSESRTCTGPNGSTRSMLVVVHKFKSIDACIACRDNSNCEGTDPAGLVGQFTACGNTATCTTAGSCIVEAPPNKDAGSCNFSATIPDCSVYQTDCLNGIYPNAGIIEGGIGFNCTGSCGEATPTPTPTSFSMQCAAAAAFDNSWNAIANLNSITVGQVVNFTVNGTTNEPQGLTKARFTINGGTPLETTTKHGTDFYIQYTVTTARAYTVQADVFNPVLGWK